MSALLVAAVALPALAALVCAAAGATLGDRAGRLGAAGAGSAFALAAVLLGAVVASGPVVLAARGERGGAGLVADRLSAVMLLLVLGVSAVVQAYAGRYLSGDRRQVRLIVAAGLTTTAVAAMVTAAALSVLIAAWIATGAGLLALLAQRADLPAARVGLRRAAVAFAVGDAALVLAGIVIWSTVGDLRLLDVESGATRLSAATVSIGRRVHRSRIARRLPARRRRDGPVGAAPAAALAARDPGRAHAGVGAPARRAGERGRLPARAPGTDLRALGVGDRPRVHGRSGHRGLRHRAHARQARRQGGAGALDDGPDGLHGAGVLAGRLRRGDLPPRRPRHVQGDAVPRRGLGRPQRQAPRRSSRGRRRPAWRGAPPPG